jgi:nucleotide-binding universal stress UspA family protein
MSEAEERTVPSSAAIPLFKRILLATDFSVRSAAAVPYARLLAEYYGAVIVVVHVIASEAHTGGAIQTQAEMEKARDLAESQVRSFVAENPLGRAPYETVVGQGPVWEVFAPLVEEKHIDLIVLGTHGRSPVGKLLLGSVAQRIFSLAPCPVLTVSPRAHKTWDPNCRLARILYATDFLVASLKALPYALSLARVSDAELLLLHAPEASAASSTEIVQGCHQHLNALIPPQERSWCRSDTLVTVGDPERVILDAAEQNSADLIVIGAHALEASLSSFQVPLSTAYRVVANAPCPVLRVRS